MANPRKQLDAAIAVGVSDMHTGSTVGLCPPGVELDDGGTYKPSPPQRWLWRNWVSMWRDYGEMKRHTGLPLVVFINGDAGDGDHHDTPQIITRNPATQLRIAARVLEPVLDVADVHFIIRGTEAHVGKSAWIEELIAEDTGAVPCTDTMHSWWHLLAEIGGVTFDIKHHPESGSMRPWTKGAEANRMAAILLYQYAASGDRPPDIALRAHKHSFNDSGYNHRTRVFTTPAWQFDTAFVHRIGAGGGINPKGSLYFTCRDGDYTFGRMMYQPKRDRPVKVQFNND